MKIKLYYRKKKAAVAIVEENDLEWTAAVPFVDLATKPPPRERPVFGPVKCSNNRSTLNCIRWGDDVFVPFSFLKTEFEVIMILRVEARNDIQRIIQNLTTSNYKLTGN